MANNMVFCRGCGKEIHETALTCPHCGAPQRAGRTDATPIHAIVEPAARKPWYDNSFLTLLLLIGFFPIGLLTMWKFKQYHLWVRIAITVLIGLCGLSVLGKKSHSSPATYEATVAEAATLPQVDAMSLVSAYEGNELAGDQQYKNKRFVINGYVGAIGKGAFNNDYVVLTGGNPLRNVQCFLKNSDEVKKAVSLIQGMPVRISGTIDGLMMNVIVKECVILQ